MSDLKTNWDNAPVGDVGLEGDLITARGTDPNVDTSGTSALNPLWTNAPVDVGSQTEESANSVSGLPATPSRYQPTEQPPGPPSLADRSPATIDEQ